MINDPGFIGDSLDSEWSVRGTTDFGEELDWWERYKEDRQCSNCGEPIQDSNPTNLCHKCRQRCKSAEIQALVRKLVKRDRELKARERRAEMS